jgi:hypothetical protein
MTKVGLGIADKFAFRVLIPFAQTVFFFFRRMTWKLATRSSEIISRGYRKMRNPKKFSGF